MNKKNNISIIGAGISGIATAVSLIKKGYCVDVFESKKIWVEEQVHLLRMESY